MTSPFAQPDASSQRANVLVYGDSGRGKTVFAGTACNDPTNPDVAIINTEGGGFKSIVSVLGYTPMVANVRNKKDLEDAYRWLAANPEAFNTVILDSLTDLTKYLLEDIIARNPRRKRPAPDVACKEDYNELSSVMDKMLRRFRDLDVNLILIALEKVVSKGEGEDAEKSLLPNVPGQLAQRLPALVDFVLYAGVKQVEVTDENPWGRAYLAQTTAEFGRVGKDRSNKLPRFVPMHWRHIAAADGRDEGLPIDAAVQVHNGTAPWLQTEKPKAKARARAQAKPQAERVEETQTEPDDIDRGLAGEHGGDDVETTARVDEAQEAIA